MRAHARQIECDTGMVACVRLAGALTIETASIAREALLKGLAAQPAVLVADVSALTVPDDIVLTLLPSIARHAAAWPGIPFVLARPSLPLAAALERTAVMRFVPVVGSVDEACRSVDRTPPHRFAERSSGGPSAVTAARALVRGVCARWRVPSLADTAELMVSELASNAVRHAGGSIETIVALRQRYLHLSVRDGSSAPPRIGRGDGRGLLLVEALTMAWGYTATADGKVVWATLRPP
jgi:anti-sigma regulatory factor (Ser/Thr protein kinase)